MKWKEVISVRVYSEEMKKQAISEAVKLNLSDQEDDMPEHIEVLEGNDLDPKICIMMEWNNERQPPAKSGIADMLVQAFSEFGWVNHTVWIRQKIFFRDSQGWKGGH